jgi:hypothetical protein
MIYKTLQRKLRFTHTDPTKRTKIRYSGRVSTSSVWKYLLYILCINVVWSICKFYHMGRTHCKYWKISRAAYIFFFWGRILLWMSDCKWLNDIKNIDFAFNYLFLFNRLLQKIYKANHLLYSQCLLFIHILQLKI